MHDSESHNEEWGIKLTNVALNVGNAYITREVSFFIRRVLRSIMANCTEHVVEPATSSILESYWAIIWHPLLILSQIYERYANHPLLLVVDTAIYYVMSCLLVVLAFADKITAFVDKTKRNVQLIRTFFKHKMYENIN